MVEVILPELGEGITEATISYWHFGEETISKKVWI